MIDYLKIYFKNPYIFDIILYNIWYLCYNYVKIVSSVYYILNPNLTLEDSIG